MSRKNPVNYVNNKQFYDCIVEWKEDCENAKVNGVERPVIPRYAGECIYMIANKFAEKYNYRDYSFREEMVSDAIENCIMYFHDFDPAKSKNPFAYFTQITYYAFLRRIGKEEKNRYAIYKYFDTTMALTENAELLTTDGKNSLLSEPVYDNISEFIHNFEKKEERKKTEKVIKTKKKGLVIDKDSE